jgi:hypothetical protein
MTGAVKKAQAEADAPHFASPGLEPENNLAALLRWISRTRKL